jgi:hypothetical protein
MEIEEEPVKRSAPADTTPTPSPPIAANRRTVCVERSDC